MKIVLQNVLLLLVFVVYQYLCLEKDSITVGVLFNEDDNQEEVPLQSAIFKQNQVRQIKHYATNIVQVSKSDSFQASQQLCEMLNSNRGVAAVFGVGSATTSAILQSISSYYEIPFILTSWRPTPTESEEKMYTDINFFPKAEVFEEGLAAIVKSLHWKSFVIIYETEEGLIKLQEVLKLQDYNSKQNSITVKQMVPGPDQRQLLKEIKNTTENNIILDCQTDKIIPVLLQAKELKMLDTTNSYFLTSLDAHTLDYSILDSGANITSIRLFDYQTEEFSDAFRSWEQYENNNGHPFQIPNKTKIKTETALFYDALNALLGTINDLSHTSGIKTYPISCEQQEKYEHGIRIISFMKRKTHSSTLTGPLIFDERGNRNDCNIYLTNFKNIIANWSAATKELKYTRSDEQTASEEGGSLVNKTLRISSKIGEPYLRYRTPSHEGEILTGNDRFEGHAKDLIDAIAKMNNFNYEFKIAPKNEYGTEDPVTKKWTGMIGDILERNAELAIADLTITHQRREVVDFSSPFLTLGISILYRYPDERDINMFAFLDPFSTAVWIYTGTLYLIISVVLYFISRMTPGDWENPHPCDENPEELENIWDIKNCLWLTLGSIMTQGCDILPKGISSRMAVSMWWFFSLIMTSSYTANLAAFLTKDRMEATIDSAEALSKQNKIKYGSIEKGSTRTFFKDSTVPTYQRMSTAMESSRPSVFEKENKKGVERVLNTRHALYAFLMESTQIEYEVITKCKLKQIGNWLDTKTYGIAMPMNYPYRTLINKSILKMQESGQLQDLKKKWWEEERKEPRCNNTKSKDDEDGADLDLANVGGVFLVLGAGIGIAYILAISEFLWNIRNVSVEEHMSYWEALKVELKFACNVWITKKRTKPIISGSSSSSSQSAKSDKIDSKSIVHSIMQSAGSFMNLKK